MVREMDGFPKATTAGAYEAFLYEYLRCGQSLCSW